MLASQPVDPSRSHPPCVQCSSSKRKFLATHVRLAILKRVFFFFFLLLFFFWNSQPHKQRQIISSQSLIRRRRSCSISASFRSWSRVLTFTIEEALNPSVVESYVVQKRRSKKLEALKLGKFSDGFWWFQLNLERGVATDYRKICMFELAAKWNLPVLFSGHKLQFRLVSIKLVFCCEQQEVPI